jgi:hypothetical protein
VYDLGERIQKKYGTNLGSIFALSRGATVDEALEAAQKVRERVAGLQEGTCVARAPWPEGASGPFRPEISAEGTADIRVRRAEILLPEGANPQLAPGVDIITKPDGARFAVYPFRTEEELADWDIQGHHYLMSGMHLKPGTVARWKHAVGAGTSFTLSTWCLGEVDAVSLGTGTATRIRADATERTKKRTGWPPQIEDMVRLTFETSPASGLAFIAERGTIQSLDSITKFVPPLSRQKASAAFVAGIDVERVVADIKRHARANKINPIAFRKFYTQLEEMVERAAEPECVTVKEVADSKFGAIISTYVSHDPGAKNGKPYSVLTRLYPERGELPRPWYLRVRERIEPDGELSAPRLVSLEVRDMVYEDFSLIMILVAVGVAASLGWSFRSVRWSLASLLPVVSGVAMMLATMLLVGHQLNFVNVLIFPIIVGIGIDYGIHVVHRYVDGDSVANIIAETGRAFMLTSLTTMVGFGSLMVSRYKGLASLGFVSVLGIFFCLYFSLVALPALLAIFENKRKMAPATPAQTE